MATCQHGFTLGFDADCCFPELARIDARLRSAPLPVPSAPGPLTHERVTELLQAVEDSVRAYLSPGEEGTAAAMVRAKREAREAGITERLIDRSAHWGRMQAKRAERDRLQRQLDQDRTRGGPW